MAFGGYTNIKRADHGTLRGIQKEVACECWFTSSGKLMPLMIKVQDEEGQIQISPSPPTPKCRSESRLASPGRSSGASSRQLRKT